MKNLILVFSIPFATLIICVLFICLACISPFFLIGYIISTKQRKDRRQSEFYPNDNLDLKERVKNYLKTREVRM